MNLEGRKGYSLFDQKKALLMKGEEDTPPFYCHKVDGNCSDVVENTCHFCRYGHFEVVDHTCPQGGSKFCGEGRCGGRGEPACLRGRFYTTIHERFQENPCQEHSPVGYCLPGLHPFCDENNILVCL